MITTSTRHLINPTDHAEMTLIRRRSEYLELKSDTVAWQNPSLRKQIEEAYADVKDGIGVIASSRKDKEEAQ
jgi:hypothetical protein